MIPDMKLAYLTWEAFATLVTGVAAVCAAYLIGRAQVGIASRQTEILTEQAAIQKRLADLEELKLRQALFDDRFDVYEATRAFLSHIVAHASVPGLSMTENQSLRQENIDLQQRFMEQVDRSTFLFRPSVKRSLYELWSTAVKLDYHQKMQRDRNGQNDRILHVDAEFKALKELSALHGDLAAVFGDELTLTAHGVDMTPKATPVPDTASMEVLNE